MLAKIVNSDGSIQVGSSNIQPSTVVRDLGPHLDSELSLKHHVTKVVAACYYHLRRLRQIRLRVGQEVATRLVLAMVISRLDYCNAALTGLPQATVTPHNGYRTRRLAVHPRDCHVMSITVVLATSSNCAPLCIRFPRDVSSVSVKHCWARRCKPYTSQTTFHLDDGLLTATAVHKVRRTFIQPRPSLCVERPAWRFAHHCRPSEVQTAAEDLLFYYRAFNVQWLDFPI